MKKFLILVCLLLLAFAVQAQEEEEAEDVGYLQLGSNFAVPDLPGWEHSVEGETAIFSNAALNAQIFVSAYDTQDIDSAITQAMGSLYSGDLPAPIYSSRIGRGDGTWEYRLFDAGDTSATAYGMLKSGRVFVVAFIENSTDYEAHHLAIRSTIAQPEGTDLNTALSTASLAAIQSIQPEFAGEAQRVSNPNSETLSWVLADYGDNLATASYINNDIVYVTLVQGDAALAPELSNAFDTVFLGFVITPNNSEYLYLGLTFATVIMLVLIGSMWLRYNNLQKDLLTIEKLAE